MGRGERNQHEEESFGAFMSCMCELKKSMWRLNKSKVMKTNEGKITKLCGKTRIDPSKHNQREIEF